MLDVGWPELLVIAIVLVVVVGPKDLPRMLRSFGKSTAKLRSMANDFRRQFDEALKEAELDEVKSVIDNTRKLDPTSEIRKQLNPINKIGDEIKGSLSEAAKAPEKQGKAGAGAQTEAPAAKAAGSAQPASKTRKAGSGGARKAATSKKAGGGAKKASAAKSSARRAKTEKQT